MHLHLHVHIHLRAQTPTDSISPNKFGILKKENMTWKTFKPEVKRSFKSKSFHAPKSHKLGPGSKVNLGGGSTLHSKVR